MRRLLTIASLAVALAGCGAARPPSEAADPLGEAYRVQRERAAERGPVVGYKIALASEAAQEAFGVDRPIYGPLFADQRVEDDGVVAASDWARFGLETELAFVIDRAIERPVEDEAELRSLVRSIHLAFDLPENRFSGRPTAAELVVDGAGAHRFALGPARDPGDIDVDGIALAARRGDAVIYEGLSGAVAGGQWGCLLWAIDHLVGRGVTIEAGAVFLTGSVDEPFAAAPADAPGEYVGEGGPLGEIRVVVE